jgi:hypothetical protein
MNQKKNDIFKRKKVKEEDFLQALENISKKLIYKFKFGYHEIEDMKQQAAIFALEGLENYDNKRPLENFLWTHVRNRLFNFKRDNYFRPDNVCVGCPFFDPKFKKSANQCAKFLNKNDCSIYSQWSDRNTTKKNIMQPTNIDHSDTDLKSNNNIFDFISNNELLSIIEDKIHTKYRETYLKLKGGSKVSKQDLKKLQDHISQILQEYNHD